ncbi:hypothetical protein [Nocardioides aurantiacus]|uniref:Uncharacterized protein n=1 Tax=Nocardioides aurantiacus TaxID=86796 RepID=A0A3N2CR33_9ACTN|nr:hypothetical protein [Nocardioides aurantiacus]ROR89990.1 hypothetical protein EDD33_0822 [Nocardioides aurantiacus]
MPTSNPQQYVRRSSNRRRVGLPGPYDAFTLAPGLTAPGDVPLAEALTLVMTAWVKESVPVGFTAPTLRRYEHNLTRFVAYTTAMGYQTLGDIDPTICADWVHARPSGKMWPSNTTGLPAYGTQANRRTSLINFFATCHHLGLWDENPGEKVTTHGRSVNRVRPLSPAEAQRVMDRAAYRARESKLPAVVALAMAGATVTEIPQVEVNDVHLTEGVVWLPGLGRRNLPRWVALDAWQTDALTARITYLTRSHGSDLSGLSLARRDRVADQDPTKVAMATNGMLWRALNKAGLTPDDGVRPTSIHEYVANRVYIETGSVEAVAVTCGLRSLDAAARLLTTNWRTNHEVTAPVAATRTDRYNIVSTAPDGVL